MAPPRLRDERLCWLAVRDTLRRRVMRRRMIDTLLTLGLAPSLSRDWEQHRLERWSVAVERLAERLTDAERVILRGTGQVPGWFLPELLRRRRTRERQR